MRTQKITPPEGYEIDKEKSTFEEIVFKPIKKELPKRWEELEKIDGFWVDICSEICDDKKFACVDTHKNIFATKAQAKASIALAQLSQLREVYRDGWVPDWYDNSVKHCIVEKKGHIQTGLYYSTVYFLSFQSPEIRDEFYNNFKDLIEEASPLLFG